MKKNTLVCVLRRDLRISDNPILDGVVTRKDDFAYFLPLYIFPAEQIELSGFIQDKNAESPYPEARSQLGGFWRCGPHRAKFAFVLSFFGAITHTNARGNSATSSSA
jgi:deoxyribodipyrimidine photo-lyase